MIGLEDIIGLFNSLSAVPRGDHWRDLTLSYDHTIFPAVDRESINLRIRGSGTGKVI